MDDSTGDLIKTKITSHTLDFPTEQAKYSYACNKMSLTLRISSKSKIIQRKEKAQTKGFSSLEDEKLNWCSFPSSSFGRFTYPYFLSFFLWISVDYYFTVVHGILNQQFLFYFTLLILCSQKHINIFPKHWHFTSLSLFKFYKWNKIYQAEQFGSPQ